MGSQRLLRGHCNHYDRYCAPGVINYWHLQTKGVNNPTVKERTLPKELRSLRKKTSWSWEKMCREFHRVMGTDGPSHTTLFRYAGGKVKRPNILTERYVQEAIRKISVELAKKEKQNRQA